MKRILLFVSSAVIVLGLGALVIWSFRHRRDEAAQEAGAASAEAVAGNATNRQGLVTLDADTQKRVALRVAAPAPAKLSRDVKAYGRVLDPAPLAAAAMDLDSALAAAKATGLEFERLTRLQRQDNASLRALQAAEAAARHDQLLVQSARDRLRLGWGNAVLEQRDITHWSHAFTALEKVLVRLDLPAGETIGAQPTGARLIPLLAENQPVEAAFFGPAPSVDPQTQGQGFLFVANSAAAGLTPGSAVTGYLHLPGPASAGVIVPRDAIVRYESKSWIFTQTGPTTFARHRIALEHPTDAGWFVTAGLTTKDTVVVAGAETLLARELSAASFFTGQRD